MPPSNETLNSHGAAGGVAVVGTLNVDHIWRVPILPRPGQTILATTVERQFGGKGANQAVAAARQGAKVTLLGAVGDDAEGVSYRQHLQRQNVDSSFVATVPDIATGTAHVYVDPQGENLIVVDRGANAHLDPAPLAGLLATTAVLVVQLECDLAAAVAALRLAAAHGVRTVFNASPVDPHFPWGAQPIDTVIVNEHECRACFEHPSRELWEMPPASREALLAAKGVQHLVVTQGSEPTLHFAAGLRDSVPTFPVTPIDTVGAGDTFAGTLAAQLAAGVDWNAALRHANCAAALSTLAIGAQTAMPKHADVVFALARPTA